MLIKSLLKIFLSVLPDPQHPTQKEGDGLYLRWRWGWLRGWLYRPYWHYLRFMYGTKFTVGRRFCLQGDLILVGPGEIKFGDDVIVGTLCTPFTHSEKAQIIVGDRTYLNGTRFGCSEKIEIGNDCILADVRLMDTDFHALHKQRNKPGMEAEVKPIRIGNNVWVAASSAVLKGVEIGDDSVVAYGSIVTKPVGRGKIAAGNPAKEIADVPEGPRLS